MKSVNEQLLKLMYVIQGRAELNPKGAIFVVNPDLFVDCPDYEPLMEKLAQEYKAIDIKQHPDEQRLDYDQLAMIESDLTDYYSYRLTLTSNFEPLLHTLSNNDAPQAPAQSTSDPDTAQYKVTFDAKASILSYGDKTYPIKPRTFQYYVCKLTFKNDRNRRYGVEELEIIYAKDRSSTSKTPVRDAVNAINARVKINFGIEKLFSLKDGTVRINTNYL